MLTRIKLHHAGFTLASRQVLQSPVGSVGSLSCLLGQNLSPAFLVLGLMTDMLEVTLDDDTLQPNQVRTCLIPLAPQFVPVIDLAQRQIEVFFVVEAYNLLPL